MKIIKSDFNIFDEEIQLIMKLSEKSLSSFLSEEPDIYCIENIKVRYNQK